MTIRDLVVRFGFEIDKDSEKEAQNGIKKIKNFAAKLLGTIGIGLSIAGISGLAEAAADAEALRSQFSQVFGEIETEAKRRLQAVADDTGVNANRMMASFSGIAAFAKVSGVQQAEALELSERAMVAVADSAAYYDRSIEEVTESLRSFLKGNFENDAALGLSATETTRNTAANALYGKSFKDLSEAEKQFTLLKMVEDANRASGALGQAARESDTWTNQLGNLKQSLKGLKAAAGGPILQPAVAVLKILVSLTQRATKAVEGLAAENGVLTRATDRYHALVKRLQPAIDRMTQTFSKGMNRGIEVVKGVVGKLGGVENVLKILVVVAGAFLLAMNWGKIISGAGIFLKLISGIGKMFSFANLKVLAVVAVIAALVLIAEDFIHFLLGNDSVIGTVFDKLGIGAGNARQAIFDAFRKVKDFLVSMWQIIVSTLPGIWNTLYEAGSTIFAAIAAVIVTIFNGVLMFWRTWGAQILVWFKVLWDSMGKIANSFLNIVKGIVDFISSVFTGNWQGAWEAIKEIFIGIWDAVTACITAAWETIKLLFKVSLSIIQAVWNAAWENISSFFQNIWNGIVSFLQSVWSAITGTISDGLDSAYKTVVSALTAIQSFFSSIFTGVASSVDGTFSNMLDSIRGKVSAVKETIVEGFNAAINWLKGLPPQAVQWGADFIGGLKDGILSGVQGVVDAVKGVGERIRSFLHFSVPDEGPLTDYESWMPDFMGGLAQGISESEDTVLDRIRSLAGSIQTLMSAATARAATAAAGTVNNSTSSVTQNVNIQNSYTGGGADAQRTVPRAMKKSASDATTQMARALAYTRG